MPSLDGPGGYCILCEDYLIYKNEKGEKRVKYPKRVGAPENRGQLIVTLTFYKAMIK